MKDYEEGPEWSLRSHYEEWVKLVEKVVENDQIKEKTSQFMKINYSIHFHVWTQAELFELFTTLKKRFRLNFDIELSLKSNEEIIFILKKI